MFLLAMQWQPDGHLDFFIIIIIIIIVVVVVFLSYVISTAQFLPSSSAGETSRVYLPLPLLKRCC